MLVIRRLRLAFALMGLVLTAGVIGYWLFGMSLVDAMYMTAVTVTTVGYRELFADDPTDPQKIFTIVIIFTGVATVFYALTLIMQATVEGQLRDAIGKRRMERQISKLDGHVIVCGWGRVGKSTAAELQRFGRDVVVIDQNPNRTEDIDHYRVVGDATHDEVLREAGIERAFALVAALHGDAENLFVTMSAKTLQPGLFVVARAREEESVPKLSRAGADRVVNPQELGAVRMASFVVEPNVAEFVDVVMHERTMDFRMQEVTVRPDSPLCNKTLREINLAERVGAQVLALRGDDGTFRTNPDPDTELHPNHIIIAVGTGQALAKLEQTFA